MEIMNWAANNLPFVALVAGQHPPHNRPLLTRITEQTLVAIIASAMTIYVDNAKQDEKITALTNVIYEMKNDIKDMRHDLYEPKERSERR